ncbi:acid phosphatase 1-like [Rutidosis leptorrhynchoides]|uniref:acid phosphatase 1-like n=1 Tax=Rutidosis leptorrhynchoides TaxID=125765 RepID=UPI003A9A0B0B
MNWEVVPEECISYVRDYMTGPQYFYDCFIAVSVAITHAESVELTGDGKDAWILDVDQTVLSLIDYYALPTVQYGAIPHNDTMFQEWLAQGVATPNILVRVLYRNLIEMGFKDCVSFGIIRETTRCEDC